MESHHSFYSMIMSKFIITNSISCLDQRNKYIHHDISECATFLRAYRPYSSLQFFSGWMGRSGPTEIVPSENFNKRHQTGHTSKSDPEPQGKKRWTSRHSFCYVHRTWNHYHASTAPTLYSMSEEQKAIMYHLLLVHVHVYTRTHCPNSYHTSNLSPHPRSPPDPPPCPYPPNWHSHPKQTYSSPTPTASTSTHPHLPNHSSRATR